ncbi:NAD dependent epimerase/dehydratase family protein [Aspergillus luchuensis]|uniref:NAD dependent epimerase/dehydratase family protein n=1 Tax=Aspergillus kawachii TaxID=1069201 RepID=A0A146FPC0_ASPKA|nr:NAD dependent epimerase/dehydratase family protein [Aspergillus luchuensis]
MSSSLTEKALVTATCNGSPPPRGFRDTNTQPSPRHKRRQREQRKTGEEGSYDRRQEALAPVPPIRTERRRLRRFCHCDTAHIRRRASHCLGPMGIRNTMSAIGGLREQAYLGR